MLLEKYVAKIKQSKEKKGLFFNTQKQKRCLCLKRISAYEKKSKYFLCHNTFSKLDEHYSYFHNLQIKKVIFSKLYFGLLSNLNLKLTLCV